VRKSNKCELLKEKWKRGKWRENECEKCVPRVLWSYGIFRAETKLRAEGVCVCVRSYSLTLEMNESDEWGLFRHFIETLWCGSEIYLGTHFDLSHCGPLIFLRCSFFFFVIAFLKGKLLVGCIVRESDWFTLYNWVEIWTSDLN
jgi:hypothetical protein